MPQIQEVEVSEATDSSLIDKTQNTSRKTPMFLSVKPRSLKKSQYKSMYTYTKHFNTQKSKKSMQRPQTGKPTASPNNDLALRRIPTSVSINAGFERFKNSKRAISAKQRKDVKNDGFEILGIHSIENQVDLRALGSKK